LSFQVPTHSVMDAASSSTLRWVPPRNHLLVSSANQRTRFIHDDNVGVKWNCDDVADLVDEQRVGRQLEGVVDPRFETERLPDPAHCRLAHPRRLGHAPRRPVCCVGRLLGRRLDHDRLNMIIGDRAQHAGTVLVGEAVEPLRQEPGPPLADGDVRPSQLGRDHQVRLALGETLVDADDGTRRPSIPQPILMINTYPLPPELSKRRK